MLSFFVLSRSASRYVHWNFKAKALISCAKAPSIVCAMCKACAQFSWFLELRSSTSCSRNRRKTPHVMADSRGCLLHRCMKEAKGKWHRIFCKVCNLVQCCVTAYGRNVVKTQPYAPLWVTDIVRVTDSPWRRSFEQSHGALARSYGSKYVTTERICMCMMIDFCCVYCSERHLRCIVVKICNAIYSLSTSCSRSCAI